MCVCPRPTGLLKHWLKQPKKSDAVNDNDAIVSDHSEPHIGDVDAVDNFEIYILAR